MADIFDVVSDPNRRQLLTALREGGEVSVGELVERVGLSQPTVSKHLKVLRDHGLVVVREDGQHRYYRVEVAPFAVLEEWLTPFLLNGHGGQDATEQDPAASTVFAAWSGADAGSNLGRRVAEGQHQVRSAIQDASDAVQKALPPSVRKRIFGGPDGSRTP